MWATPGSFWQGTSRYRGVIDGSVHDLGALVDLIGFNEAVRVVKQEWGAGGATPTLPRRKKKKGRR